jgi:hypothetical protein
MNKNHVRVLQLLVMGSLTQSCMLVSVNPQPSHVERKLRSITIPEHVYYNAAVVDVVENLQMVSKKYDAAGEGVRFSCMLGIQEGYDLQETRTAMFEMRNATLYETLTALCRAASVSFAVDEYGVIVYRGPDVPDSVEAVVYRRYHCAPEYVPQEAKTREIGEYPSAIYSAVLEYLSRGAGDDVKHGLLVVSDRTTSHWPKLPDSVTNCCSLETIRSYERNNRAMSNIGRKLSMIPDIAVVKEPWLRSLSLEDDYLRALRERYPEAKGVVRFSGIGAGRSVNEAVIGASLHAGPLAGIEFVFLLCEIGNRWVIVLAATVSVS